MGIEWYERPVVVGREHHYQGETEGSQGRLRKG